VAQPEFEAAPDLYERFLQACVPESRRHHGVYSTPAEVARAQVRLVDDLLRRRLGCEAGLVDARVTIMDPAVGSGVYPLAILDHCGPSAVDALKRRMRLFETRPGAAALARARGLPVEECDALASTLELDAPILVCLGNPPYRRRAADPSTRAGLADLADAADGIHLKNLYNDYVHFWRWALRTACEARRGPAVLCFVTAGSYLRGPGFGGLRRLLRQLLDEFWVVDLEGDQRAARASDNVFPIRTPVAIALGVRYAHTRPRSAARVHYARLTGSSADKRARLGALRSAADLDWQPVTSAWSAPLTSARHSAYSNWPALTELFPWQLSGAQLKRTWPIGVTRQVLRSRWRYLLQLPFAERRDAFGPTRDRDIDASPPDLLDDALHLRPLSELASDDPGREPMRYAYRPFDRHWVLPDARVGDFMRPKLWRISGPGQVFLTSMLTNVLGPGPAAVATALVPDMDHFRGSFGARHVIPLWRDASATVANVSGVHLARLSQKYGFDVSAPALMAYCYALLAAPSYTRRFEEELRTPGPRVPLTGDAAVFQHGAALGCQLLRLHTYREMRDGRAQVLRPIGDGYPGAYSYDAAREVICLGDGLIGPVTAEAWAFSVSGYAVAGGWLRRRLRRGGKSLLDSTVPTVWPHELTRELLELLWLIEATLARHAALDALLDEAAHSATT
jgi:predicted helicase